MAEKGFHGFESVGCLPVRCCGLVCFNVLRCAWAYEREGMLAGRRVRRWGLVGFGWAGREEVAGSKGEGEAGVCGNGGEEGMYGLWDWRGLGLRVIVVGCGCAVEERDHHVG
jgi:hypothetical protein